MNLFHEAVVVGGGVAGSSLAAVLAVAGTGVVLIEREQRFRDRIRGEAIHPWGAAEVNRLGLIPTLRAAGARPLPVWQRYADRAPLDPHRWSDMLPGGEVEWAVSHPALQEALVAHAAASGAVVLRPARAISVRRAAGRQLEVEVVTDGGISLLRTRLVVGADGTRSLVRRWLKGRMQRDPIHHVIGGGLIAGTALDRQSAHQASLPGAMVVVFPQGADLARGYLVCSPERAAAFRGRSAVPDFVAACGAAFPAEAFVNARSVAPVGFFPGVDIWTDRLSGDGMVLVGDAAGTNDPSQGHGLSLAFRDARELRDLLLEDRNWFAATGEFAARRARYYTPLRAHARWMAVLITEEGAAANARRAQVARAREADPSAGGFAGIYATGPDGLVGDEQARRRFFGEDLDRPSFPLLVEANLGIQRVDDRGNVEAWPAEGAYRAG